MASRIKAMQAMLAKQKGGSNLAKKPGKRPTPKPKPSNQRRNSLDNSALLKKPTVQTKKRRKRKTKKFDIVRHIIIYQYILIFHIENGISHGI